MASSPHSAGFSTVTLSVSHACAQPVSVHRHSQLRGTERVPASLLKVTRLVARSGGTQIVDHVAPEPGFSTPALSCLCPE